MENSERNNYIPAKATPSVIISLICNSIQPFPLDSIQSLIEIHNYYTVIITNIVRIDGMSG